MHMLTAGRVLLLQVAASSPAWCSFVPGLVQLHREPKSLVVIFSTVCLVPHLDIILAGGS
jgi:hypothetical protein